MLKSNSILLKFWVVELRQDVGEKLCRCQGRDKMFEVTGILSDMREHRLVVVCVQ